MKSHKSNIWRGASKPPYLSFSLAQRKELKETSTPTKPPPIWGGLTQKLQKPPVFGTIWQAGTRLLSPLTPGGGIDGWRVEDALQSQVKIILKLENMPQQRFYSKKELALLYFPQSDNAHTAVNHLVAWIRRCPQLTEALAAAHYHNTDKVFTPQQVTLITSYLGDPDGLE